MAMADVCYAIQYDGRVVDGFTVSSVKRQLGQLLKLDSTVLEQLFSGRMITVKSGLDKQRALAYQRTLHNTGALVHIVEVTALQRPGLPQRSYAVSGGVVPVSILACPRCHIEQTQLDRCTRCNMDLRRHWMRHRRSNSA
jgi:hypothetical protein